MPTIEWDLKTLDADSFKKKFEEEIMKPVEEVIKKSKTTPGVQLPAELHASMLGLTSALAGRLSVAMESATSQMMLDVHNTYGSPDNSSVMFVQYHSIKSIRELGLSIVDVQCKCMSPVLSIALPLEGADMYLQGSSFAPQRSTVRLAERGISFPLLFFWKISELVPTNCPDTFVSVKIIPLFSPSELRQYPEPVIEEGQLEAEFMKAMHEDESLHPYAADAQFKKAMYKDESLRPYIYKTCMVCSNSGVQKLFKCARCGVAYYCGKDHQFEHWSVHKYHCKKLRALKTRF